MLAPRTLPESYADWNRRHGAPFGVYSSQMRRLRHVLPTRIGERMRGPFQYQKNNTTRVFEHPWAFEAGNIRKGLDVLEIGGGLSGFQFVLSQEGCNVTNVDPGMERDSFSWPCDPSTIARLNDLYGTDVQLRNTVLEDAGLDSESFDLAFSVSVLEHLPEDALASAMRETFRVLRPGGRMVMTIDLFLNVAPFTRVQANRFGTNIEVQSLLK
jgi:2-polyprenyl-3-methyl-5-hydroxy-6-metoxy-1,4-benzoquinol methylase